MIDDAHSVSVVTGAAPRAPGDLFPETMAAWSPWIRVKKFDADACRTADRHYSRRKIGSPQFMPPGQTLVLATSDRSAIFGWWRPDPSSGIAAMNGLDGWTCTIFRNEAPHLYRSSDLVLAAERALYASGHTIGSDGLITYVFDNKVRSRNPGCCFKKAGWRVIGRSADDRKTLLQKHAASLGARGATFLPDHPNARQSFI